MSKLFIRLPWVLFLLSFVAGFFVYPQIKAQGTLYDIIFIEIILSVLLLPLLFMRVKRNWARTPRYILYIITVVFLGVCIPVAWQEYRIIAWDNRVVPPLITMWLLATIVMPFIYAATASNLVQARFKNKKQDEEQKEKEKEPELGY